MHVNRRLFLAVLATGLLTARLVDSVPLTTEDLEDRSIALNNEPRAIEVPEVPNIGRAVIPRPRPRPRPRPNPRPDRPDNPSTGRPGANDPVAPGMGRKCPRGLLSMFRRCSDEEEEEIEEEVIDSDEEQPPEVYKAWGTQRNDDLNKKLNDIKDQPGNHDKPGVPALDRGYEPEPLTTQHAGWNDFDSVARAVKYLGLPDSMVFKGSKVRTKGNPRKLVSENYFSERSPDGNGMAVCKWNKVTDETNNAPDGKMRFSDLLFQQLKRSRDDGPVDDIKYFLRDGVNNQGTKNMIDKAVGDLKLNKDADGWESGSVTREENKDLFDTVVGTRNGKGIAWMLQDHPSSFGNKKITRVHVLRNEDQNRWAMVLETGV